jgi:hypothetical protein
MAAEIHAEEVRVAVGADPLADRLRQLRVVEVEVLARKDDVPGSKRAPAAARRSRARART